ncbi:MPDZ [Lepeophtheirus salmonis]|uniref:MPDZ n=1 Tax=Lepeophtheirus salmonis TaxID=72036 RepID=A0A7R8CWJ0_LEPSM|nr:MPDZ [Lepeophtheirus salmonis]CAF2952682.1 MPDZ [Lepeophtheirus salmonis]
MLKSRLTSILSSRSWNLRFFTSILNIQDSLRELKRQVHLHPSILPADFDITPSGELVLNLPQASPTSTSPPALVQLSSSNISNVPPSHNGFSSAEGKQGIKSEVELDSFEDIAQGREIKRIKLYKPEGHSLGFSVVGLRSEFKGELGIYLQEIQPDGLAGKDGRLIEGDQILAIDGKSLDSNISHQQAINILQRADGYVDLVVARGSEDITQNKIDETPAESCVVEVIELVNNGSGLGFGIIGGQKKGVVVKTILPDGVADSDGRLRAGDFILQINEHWLQGVGSEQVAAVLRGTGNVVKLIVARPITSENKDTSRSLPVLPILSLENREELEAHLQKTTSVGASTREEAPNIDLNQLISHQTTTPSAGVELMPEMETLDVELIKDSQGLGITIAGYTCEREELSGIFVKSVTDGSAASRSGMVAVNDQIVEVDGNSIQGYTNQQAVEMLRSTGKSVKLKLIRYVHGLKFEQLQQAIANSQSNTPITSPTQMIQLSPHISPTKSLHIEAIESKNQLNNDEVNENAVYEINNRVDSFEGELDPIIEREIIQKWSDYMGVQYEIVVAQLKKFQSTGGLGISLEGTVEKVDGEEHNPHHYIRSVLPDGPVGHNGLLKSGDELLEVNGQKLIGLYHTDVVSILKDLPVWVRIVCARNTSVDPPRSKLISNNNTSDESTVSVERLVKAKSDGSISSMGTNTGNNESTSSMNSKSRSLEPLTSLAMWAEEVLDIDLIKGDKGLGFSILDYQDPLNKDETVIVIRSLVPGGVAQQDGRLIPGDRLMKVNQVDLCHATLDEAVQALKGAPKGLVIIGVSKPLPDDNTEVRSEISDMESDTPNLPPPIPTSPPPEDEDEKNSSRINKSIGIPPLPEALERHIKVIKDSEALGVQVDIEEDGINGLIVKSITPGGTLARDGRIQPGDYMVKVNNELLRNIKHSEALNILKRTHKVPLNQDIQISFVPAGDAVVYKTTMITRLAQQKEPPIPAVREKVTSFITINNSKPEVSVFNLEDSNAVITQEMSPTYSTEQKIMIENTLGESNTDDVNPVPPPTPPPPLIEDLEKEKNPVEEEFLPPPPLPNTPPPIMPTVPPRPSKSLTSITSKDIDLSIGKTISDDDESSLPLRTSKAYKSKHWGPEREVTVFRAPNKGLGISIVGGKVDPPSSDDGDSSSGSLNASVSGIFIKNVLEGSPAGQTGQLCTGDRILEVDGNDLRTASHERAVDVIRQSNNPVVFLVQSLLGFNEEEDDPTDNDDDEEEEEERDMVEGDANQGEEGNDNISMPKDKIEAPPEFANTSTDKEEEEEESEEGELSGTETLSNGFVIDKASASFLDKSSIDDEEEDDYRYTMDKIRRKYGKFPGKLSLVRLNKGIHGLGISLAGHKDRNQMAVFICGLIPQGNAARDGRIKIGDSVLEVNGKVLHNRCHLNASSLIKNFPDSAVTFVLLTPEEGGSQCAVKPLSANQFPHGLLNKNNPIERYKKYAGLRQIRIKKEDQGLGIMIIEGKHTEAGTGVFVSDLQPDSAADKAGLLVGDMILCVNGEDFVGASYESAARVLKSLDGIITMCVANPILLLPPKPPGLSPTHKPSTVLKKPLASPRVKEEKPSEKQLPATCDIVPGMDTTIEITKDKDDDGKPMGLGLSIVGGSDTLLGAIFIHEVYEKGAAHKDGRLRPGDQILEVMNDNLRNVTHSYALHALRQTPNKVRLVIHREDDEIYETFEVELIKRKDRGLGLSIVGKKSGPGVYISEVVKGGAADSDGPFKEAAPILKMAQGKITMKVRRLRVGNRQQQRQAPAPVSGLHHVSQHSNDSNSAMAPIINGTPKTIRLERGEQGLGFSIVVFQTGAAAEHGGLKRGDQIVSVNNISLEGLTHQDAVNILKNCEGTVTIQILS